MKTTIDIPDSVMEETVAYSRATTKREAILTAMEEYNHRHRVADVMKIFGSFNDMSTNDEIEARENADHR